jgi:hypothetical protein
MEEIFQKYTNNSDKANFIHSYFRNLMQNHIFKILVFYKNLTKYVVSSFIPLFKQSLLTAYYMPATFLCPGCLEYSGIEKGPQNWCLVHSKCSVNIGHSSELLYF